MSGDILVVTTKAVLTGSAGKRPEMLLHSPQCTKRSPRIKNDLLQNINSAEVEKSWFRASPFLIQGKVPTGEG